MKGHHMSLSGKTIVFALFFVLISCGIGQTTDFSVMSKEQLQKQIAALELGLGQYVVGKKLTDEQQKISGKDAHYKAYPGTVKFKDQDIFIIIDKETNVVIALYLRNKKADEKEYKTMVGGLMVQFGEPTTMAHEKSIYWNYTEDGLISGELYRTVKDQGKLESLAVLATVKFSSTQSLEALSSDKRGKKEEGETSDSTKKEEKVSVVSDNYVMVQSDVLTKKYMGK